MVNVYSLINHIFKAFLRLSLQNDFYYKIEGPEEGYLDYSEVKMNFYSINISHGLLIVRKLGRYIFVVSLIIVCRQPKIHCHDE